MRTAVFSIIAPNYRHHARVLMGSVGRQHPQWDRFVLVVGGTPRAQEAEPFQSVALDAIALPNARQFSFRYTLLELSTAVKPWMFEHLFERGYDRVVYFDPDIFVYSPLEELDAAPREVFLTLTPHLTRFTGLDDRDGRNILVAGTYNLGFLAVARRPQLPSFLKWWQQRLERDCVVDPARGLFVDQKWMDLAPGLFADVHIQRHEGYNVAYWNLAERRVSGGTVNGQPLRFFHFSGFSPAFPDVLSKHDSGRTVSGAGDARELFDDYATALRAAGSRSFRNAPYAFSFFADGTRIPDAARIVYRNSPELQDACGGDPFQHPELFQGLRDTSRSTLAAKAAWMSYKILARARPLVRLFPRETRTAMREFLLGRRDSIRPTTLATPLLSGVNIVGYTTRDTGVGESARLCANACEAAGVPNQIIDIDDARVIPPRAVYRASVHHVNADQVSHVREQVAQMFEASAYNISVWHWELPELPDAWIGAAEPFDEIWAPSAFVQSAVAAKVTIPVLHMPHGVEVTDIEPCSPEELGVPKGRFVFLCMFDFDSVVERKNPLAAIEAFHRSGAPAALLIKTTGADRHREACAALAERVREIPNVYLVDSMLSRPRVNGLVASCDAVISLHRCEGFGLILAEAMSLGKPVIATAWSGNMDFMNNMNSCPVAYELVTIGRMSGPYAAGQQWAEPDVDHAADLMLRIASDDSYRAQISAQARETMRTRFSPEIAGLRYRRRLALLGALDDSSR